MSCNETLTNYRLCVSASGTTDNSIFIFSTFIKHSCLHFGQNIGKFFKEVSALIFVLVLHLQKGQCIQPFSSMQNFCVFCILLITSLLLFLIIFFPSISVKDTQLSNISFCLCYWHIMNNNFKNP